MKKTIALLSLLTLNSTFAAGAVSYSCVGKNAVNNESVSFSVLFGSYGPGVGYTDQNVTVIASAGIDYENPVVFQMFGANESNECSVNEFGEIMLNKGFDMTPTPEGHAADYEVTLKTNCQGNNYDVRALCYFN